MENILKMSDICPACKNAAIGNKLNSIEEAFGGNNPSYYTGNLLTSDQINGLNNMCTSAGSVGRNSFGLDIKLGTYLGDLIKTSTESGAFTYTRICNKALYDLIANSALPAGGVTDDQIDPLLKEAKYSGINELYKYYLDYMNKSLGHSYTSLEQFNNSEIISLLLIDYFSGLTAKETVTDVLYFFYKLQYIITDSSNSKLNNYFCAGINSLQLGNEINETIIPAIGNLTCLNQAKFLLFSVPNVSTWAIDSNNKKVSVILKKGYSVSSLIATFTLSLGATAKINNVVQESGVTVNDFSSPVIYTIISKDGIVEAQWTVTIKTQ